MLDSISSKLILCLVLLLPVMAGQVWINEVTKKSISKQNQQVARASEIIKETDAFLSAMQDAEIGKRGFLITGDASYLEPYETSAVRMEESLKRLKGLVSNEQRQRDRLEELGNLAHRKMSIIDLVIRLRHAKGFESARDYMVSHHAKQMMDEIRRLTQAFQEDEQRLLALGEAELEQGIRERDVYLYTGLLASLALLGLIGLYLLRSIAAPLKRLQQGVMNIAEGNLEHRLEVKGKDELSQLSGAFNRMAERVRHRQAEVDGVIESMVDGVITIDSHGIVQRFNPAAENIFGYKKKDVEGQNISMLIPEPHSSAHDGYINNYLQSGQAKVIGVGREVQGRRSDGSVFDMDLAVNEMFLEHERIFIGVVRDVSERKREQVALQETATRLQLQQEVFAMLSDHLGSSHVSLKQALHMLTENACRALGIARASVWMFDKSASRIRCLDLYEADKDLHSASQELRRDDYPRYFAALDSGNIIDAEDARSDARTAEFTESYLEPLGITAMLDILVRHEAKPAGVLCLEHKGGQRKWKDDEIQFARALSALGALLLEISRRQRAERTMRSQNIELRRASRMKSDFLANMSHELRTPLNAIIGFSEVMKDGLAGEMNPEQLEYTEDIYTSGQHLLSLINDILDLSKIEAGKMELQCDDVLIRELAQSSLTIVREKAAAHGIQLELNADNAPEVVRMDSRKVKQILFNLLSNAVKFSPDGGKVTVSLSQTRRPDIAVQAKASKWLQISVQDQGIGISEQDISRLFQAFQQLESPMTKGFEGTGLGLALVKRLAELHGGGVSVSSKPGQGSCFTVWLPIKDAATRAGKRIVAGRHAMSRSRSGSAPGPKVLVIEDDPKAATLLLLQLEQDGYRCDCVASAEDALMWLQAERPDFITLDIMLPGMDGWQFLEHLRKDKRLNDIPVVIVSIEADEQRGFALGASQVLSKPVGKSELLHGIALLGLNHSGKHLKALVVDDDVKALKLIERHLTDEGFDILSASGGKQAVEMARKHIPDFIILDLMMPEMSGFEVVEVLKDSPETASIPIMILTAKELTDEERQHLNGDIINRGFNS